jgi:hypothetical protein
LIKCCCDHSDDIKATLEETLLWTTVSGSSECQ